MNEENKTLSLEELKNVAGGIIVPEKGGRYVNDDDSDVIGHYNTLEEAKFAASGICPRCGKVFSGKQAIDGHIKEWATGKK